MKKFKLAVLAVGLCFAQKTATAHSFKSVKTLITAPRLRALSDTNKNKREIFTVQTSISDRRTGNRMDTLKTASALSGLRGTMRPVSNNDEIADIIKLLLNDAVIQKDDRLSFHITEKELTVNGIRQAEEVHQAVLKKVKKDRKENIDLTYQSTKTTFNK